MNGRHIWSWLLVTLVVVTLWAGVGGAQPVPAAAVPEIHTKHFIFGYPTGTPSTNDLIIRDCYALSSNDRTKFADWVAYRITPHEVFGTLDLERVWRADPWLAADERLEPEDFNNLASEGYDRGHQAALADFKGSCSASQANYLSNITPQKKDLNEGAWERLENMTRNLVRRYTNVWIITGPLYERDMPPLPHATHSHTVPSGYWKIVAVQPGRNPESIKVAAFIFDQDTPRDDLVSSHIVSVAEVQHRSGLDFLRELPDDVETSVEHDPNATWVAEWE